MIINVRDYVAAEKEKLKQVIKDNNLQPRLMIIQVGDNPASNSYIKGKMKDCEEVGIEVILEKHDENWFLDFENLGHLEMIISGCTGVIVQLPIENEEIKRTIYEQLYPEQDVDGLIFPRWKPCTPVGIMRLLKYMQIDLQGKVVTVLGKGELVGKPLIQMLMNEGATVISCNSKTKNLKQWTQAADIVIGATGVPRLITDEMISDGTIVIDAGISFIDGKMYGDCCDDLYERERVQITSVPGGVGLLTRLSLLQNIIDAALCEE